ncbi:pleckstrin homology domain-containing family M member 2-like [Corticium candelabrum]|uniref:pleckstrin homology domain-containing family M member 2-like n=1 Tax=Corticium candelabrum TaxID=121492 RepID=UPI002E267A53|nr:pleckstrin homology domain-containing family M member 2-like [Corticium candelabrum]
MAKSGTDDVSARKDYILDQISSAVKEIQKEQFSSDSPAANPIANGHSELQRLCEHLDNALLHGIKAFEAGYWAYVVEYTRKDELHLINHLTSVTTDLGRGRSWLYQALNENALENYLRLFTGNMSLLDKHYQPEALLRDEQRVPVLLTIAAGLDFIIFELTIDCEYFDYGAFTPSKAGLLNMGPLTSTKLISIHNCHIGKRDIQRAMSSENTNEQEVGDKAKESLGTTPSSVVSKLRNLFGRRPSVECSDVNPFEFLVAEDCDDKVATLGSDSTANALQDLSSIKKDGSYQNISDSLVSKARSVKDFTVTTATTAKIKAAEVFNRAASLFANLHNPFEEKEFAAVEAETAVVERVRTTSNCEVPAETQTEELSFKNSLESDESNRMSRMARIEKVMQENDDVVEVEQVDGGSILMEEQGDDEAMVRLEVRNLMKKPAKFRKKKRQAGEKKKKSKADQGVGKTSDGDNVSVNTNEGDSQTSGFTIGTESFIDGAAESLSVATSEELLRCPDSEVTTYDSSDVVVTKQSETDLAYEAGDNCNCTEEARDLVNTANSEDTLERMDGKEQRQDENPILHKPISQSSRDESDTNNEQLVNSENTSVVEHILSKEEILPQSDESSKEKNEEITQGLNEEGDILHVSQEMEKQLILESAVDNAVEVATVADTNGDVNGRHMHLDDGHQEANEEDKILEVRAGGRPIRPSRMDGDCNSADIEIDQNVQLMLRLEVLDKEEENLIKLFTVMLCHGKSDYQSAYILVTDDAVYVLSTDGTGGRFDTLQHLPYQSLSHLEVSINWQTVSIVNDKKKACSIILGNEPVARQLVNTIQEAVSSDAACRGLVVVTSDEARLTAFHKTFARVSKTAEPSQILLYSLVNWEPVGDAPGPIDGTSNSFVSPKAVMNGFLSVQSTILTFSYWQDDYFVLDIRNGLMMQYGSKADRECKSIFSLRAGKCGGVRRRTDVDRPNAFEIISMDKSIDSLILAAPNVDIMGKWLQAICEAVACAGMGANEVQASHTACSLCVLSSNICLFHEYHTDRSPERLAYCDISDISNINYDPESPLYAVLNFGLSGTDKSGCWLLFFSSEYELGKFEACVAKAWKDLFMQEIQFHPITNGRLRDRAQETVTLLVSSTHRNDSVTRGRES